MTENFDDLIIKVLRDGPLSTPRVADLIRDELDCTRGALERLREEGCVWVRGGLWRIMEPGKRSPSQGRPRPPHTVALDKAIHDLILQKPRTANQLSEKTGVSSSLVYLSLSRLRRRGHAELGPGRNPDRKWSAT